MSLYLANLSPRVRKDWLESVFRRFGSCSLQLRNGDGFVVYDLCGDAEKALRFLNGKRVCGELLNLSWSISQPKPLQTFVRAATNCDVRYGINSDRSRHDVHRNFKRTSEEYPMRVNHPDHRGGVHKSTHCSKLSVEPYNYRHERWEEGGHAVLNPVDNDRWNENCDNLKKRNDVNYQARYDRYVPDNGDERGKESEKCGDSGDKLRDGQMKDASQGNTSYQSDRRVDNQVNKRARRNDAARGPESQYVGRLQSSNRSSKSAERHEDDRKPLTVEKNGIKGSTSRLLSPSGRNTREDKQRKRRREKEERTSVPHDDKKSRISSAPLHSYHMSPGSTMHSRSRSPVSHLCSDSSMSKSRSNRLRSTSIKPESMPSSRLPSSSPQASLRRSLSSSPESAELSKELPSEIREQFHSQEFTAEKYGKDEKLENISTLDMLKPLETAHKADLKVPSTNNLSISKEELCRVVKHYRVQVSVDSEQHQGVEDYFGSARLWPWGIIYYRRLKKGLISTENYARRVAQNNEFGITDQYIRSSSGWAELL